MKTWSRKDEWMSYAGCGGDARFISETSSEDADLRSICGGCRVRPECIKWATETPNMCAVFVCGVRLPDPAHKRALRSDLERLRSTYHDEVVDRGEF